MFIFTCIFSRAVSRASDVTGHCGVRLSYKIFLIFKMLLDFKKFKTKMCFSTF